MIFLERVMKSESFVMVSKDVGSSVCNNRQRRKSFLKIVSLIYFMVSEINIVTKFR